MSTTATPTRYTDEYVAGLHPRQQRAFAEIPVEYRDACVSRAWLLGNTTPGLIHSQAISRAWADLQRLNLDVVALEHLNRRDNRAALGSCPCEACQRDFQKVG